MSQFIKDYLTFNKSDRNGLIILVSIIFILILVSKFSYLFIHNKPADFTKFNKEIEAFQMALTLKDSVNKSSINKDSIKLVAFNPNNTSDVVWKQLGLSDKQIKVISNYLSKGGKFYKKEDFKKIYCISDDEYLTLEPYINIPTTNASNQTYQKSVKNNTNVELNSADTTELKTLKGIGSAYAKRIVKYRELLGGYYNKSQLMEVYGMKEELYNSIVQYITIDTTKIIKININTATFKELNKNPYIKYEGTKNIVNFRDKNGRFKSINFILTNNLLPKDKYDKLKPYLTVE